MRHLCSDPAFTSTAVSGRAYRTHFCSANTLTVNERAFAVAACFYAQLGRKRPLFTYLAHGICEHRGALANIFALRTCQARDPRLCMAGSLMHAVTIDPTVSKQGELCTLRINIFTLALALLEDIGVLSSQPPMSKNYFQSHSASTIR